MPSKTNAHNANGHRRRQLVDRIKATATHCALCDLPLNPDAVTPALDSTEIDEDLPRVRGGNPLDPRNTVPMHRRCNRWKSTMTLAEARQLLALGATVHEPLNRAQRRAMLQPSVGAWETGASRWTGTQGGTPSPPG
ncbi:hypothetical protein GCM10027427_11970 [Pseudoclavibacter terrae]